MTAVSIKELLEAGVHFGHQTQKWNPKCKPFIFGQRNGIYIIDLQKTLGLFRAATEFATRLGQEGKTILFVGTKRQAQEAIREEAERSGNYYINHRWLGGLLTNWATVRKSVERLKKIEEMAQQDDWENMTKKEIARVEKKRTRLAKVFVGIKDMRRLPDALFVIDPKKERIAVLEGIRLNIPVMAVLDTNCDPDGIRFVIPGNDDAIRSIRLFAGGVSDAFLEGARMNEAKRAERDEAREVAAVGGAPADGRAPKAAREPEVAKEPPRKRITLTVPPGGQAPKPAGPSPTAAVHADGTVKVN